MLSPFWNDELCSKVADTFDWSMMCFSATNLQTFILKTVAPLKQVTPSNDSIQQNVLAAYQHATSCRAIMC